MLASSGDISRGFNGGLKGLVITPFLIAFSGLKKTTWIDLFSTSFCASHCSKKAVEEYFARQQVVFKTFFFHKFYAKMSALTDSLEKFRTPFLLLKINWLTCKDTFFVLSTVIKIAVLFTKFFLYQVIVHINFSFQNAKFVRDYFLLMSKRVILFVDGICKVIMLFWKITSPSILLYLFI